MPGRWTGTTTSPVAALDGLELSVDVRPATNPNRTGWSGQLASQPTAWARQQGPDGQLVRCTPILIMMPNVQSWFDDLAAMRAFVAEFNDNHGFNGGHIVTILDRHTEGSEVWPNHAAINADQSSRNPRDHSKVT